jgi:hypothetical protein
LISVPYDAETLTAVDTDTAAVLTTMPADVLPAATTIEGGTGAAAVSELLTVTLAPPGGAGPFNVTVIALIAPPRSVLGETAKPVSSVGVTVIIGDLVEPLNDADMVTGVGVVAQPAVTGKETFVEPAATVALAGIVASGSELDRATVAPAA